MKIFTTTRSGILLVCSGLIILISISAYLLNGDRYKASLVYRLYRCCAGDTMTVHGLYQPVEFRVNFFGMIYEGRSGNISDDQVLYCGAQEKHILFFLRDVADLSEKKDLVFFDIGANVGQHSLFMSKIVREVHAFEPYPPVLERFRRMIGINQINNIHIHPVGLANKNGEFSFFEPAEFDIGAGSFIQQMGNTTNKEITLPLVIGDEWLKKIGKSKVDIIKCDIEGYEKQALLGLKQIIERNRPIVVMELNLGTEESFHNLDDFYATFPINYDFLTFCVEDVYSGHYELCKYDRFDFGKKERFNIVVFPVEKKDLISLQN